ncbi:hypothetical protein D043_0592B, partial [Vibrio parahaemolyticus EKP-021]
RSSVFCISSSISHSSSRNSVPPWANVAAPFLSVVAPVNAPLT